MRTIYNKQYRCIINTLKINRNKMNITQSELASKIGNDQTFVSKYENYQRRLDIIELRSICIALNINFLELINEFEENFNKI